jgi:esterase/lipase
LPYEENAETRKKQEKSINEALALSEDMKRFKKEHAEETQAAKKDFKQKMDEAKAQYEKLLAAQPATVAQHTTTTNVQNGTKPVTRTVITSSTSSSGSSSNKSSSSSSKSSSKSRSTKGS